MVMDVNARAHCVCFGLIIVCNFYLPITHLLGSITSASLNYLLHYIPQLGIVTQVMVKGPREGHLQRGNSLLFNSTHPLLGSISYKHINNKIHRMVLKCKNMNIKTAN
jgi:hypothetical protein